ncbi:MAG: hypothetical protein HYY46_26535 [Deltaproteobacteria bacterium]|nr:hypothetical protein [Deltaproteobacteria bacterium]
MAGFADFAQWFRNINDDLEVWLFKQVDERNKRTLILRQQLEEREQLERLEELEKSGRLETLGLVKALEELRTRRRLGSKRGKLLSINQQIQQDGTIEEYRLGSPELPKENLITWLQSPSTTPFVGYSILVQSLGRNRSLLKEGERREEILRQWGRRKEDPPKDTTLVPTNSYERLRRARRNILSRNMLEEAWDYMEADGERTVEKNPKCLKLLEHLSRDWEQSLYDRQLLARLSFVPQPAIEWSLKMVSEAFPEVRRVHAPYRRRYLNPRTNLKNDPLVTEELKDLPPEDQRSIIVGGFRVLRKKSVKRIFSAMGIDKQAPILKQGIWRLILPPLFDYLVFLQGGQSLREKSYNRACREASRILNTRHPSVWPYSPRWVKYSVMKG